MTGESREARQEHKFLLNYHILHMGQRLVKEVTNNIFYSAKFLYVLSVSLGL